MKLFPSHKTITFLIYFTLSFNAYVSHTVAGTDNDQYISITPQTFIASDGAKYVGDLDKTFKKILVSGEVAWEKDLGIIYGRPLQGTTENIYAASNSGYLYNLNTTNGEIIWDYFARGSFRASPHMSTNHQIIYAVTVNGFVIAIGAEDGTLLWELDLEFPNGVEFISSPTFNRTSTGVETLNLIDSENTFYSVDLNTHQLMHSWSVGR